MRRACSRSSPAFARAILGAESCARADERAADPATRPSGLSADRPAFFLWLGVVPYLTRDAVLAVLRFVAARAGSEIAFDYYAPPSPEMRARVEAFAERLAAAGEPLVTQLAPEELHAALAQLGYGEIEDLDVPAIATRYLPGALERSGGSGSHLVRARAG